MNTLRNASIILFFWSMPAMAAPPSDASLKQLLAITQAQKLLDDMRAQIDSLMNNAIEQGLNGQTPNAEQQQAITNMRKRMVALMQNALVWENVEPIYLRVYKESLTEEEVAGMLSFYKTPAGQAVINKMPVIMQKTMLEFQQIMSGWLPQMQKIQQDFVTELKAAGN